MTDNNRDIKMKRAIRVIESSGTLPEEGRHIHVLEKGNERPISLSFSMELKPQDRVGFPVLSEGGRHG